MNGENERQQFDRKHIFAVNGDPMFLDLLRELLQGEDFNVTTTNFVPRTFNQIEALQPDLIMIDLVIGVQAGWDLLEQLQSQAVTSGIPVIVVSTDPRFLDIARRNQERFGTHTYIHKPLDLQELMKAIHELIGRA